MGKNAKKNYLETMTGSKWLTSETSLGLMTEERFTCFQ